MDEIVKAALAKWPAVPHCYGWLALDARGDWYMRDDHAQAAGPFPQVRGSRIVHDRLRDFIHRNYAADDRGCWHFQNGPQRVYVELEAAPYVWRLQLQDGGIDVSAHTDVAVTPHGCWLDEAGRLYLDTDLGFGSVHSLDMDLAADAVLRGDWRPQQLKAADAQQRFGYRRQPVP